MPSSSGVIVFWESEELGKSFSAALASECEGVDYSHVASARLPQNTRYPGGGANG